jgi:hypothetical protein
MRSLRACLVLMLSGALGCGQISDRTVQEASGPEGGSSGAAGRTQGGAAGGLPAAGGAPGPGGMPGSGGMPVIENCEPVPLSTPLRALSSWEYRRSVEAITGKPAGVALPTDSTQVSYFDVAMNLNAPVVEALFEAAEGQGAALDDDPALAGCDPVTPQDFCVSKLVTSFLSRAFRRSPSPHERDRFLALFLSASSLDGRLAGAEALAVAVLLSPSFLYKVQLGSDEVGAGMLTPLSSPEVGSRLAYLLTGLPPDEELSAAAAGGTLSTVEGLEAQARRLIAAPTFVDSARHFHEQWFGLDGLDQVQALGLTAAVRESMRGDAGTFVSYVYRAKPNLRDLLLSPTAYVDDSLAQLYGLAPTQQAGLVQVQLDPAVRAGVLTQLATLTRFSNPTQRGLLVRNRLLCGDVPPSPPNVDNSVEIEPSQTRRQAWELHLDEPVCAACHRLVDPIGFGFESFDELGRFRTTDPSAVPIDNTGELFQTEGEGEGPFTGAVELAQKLSGGSLVARCFARNWWTYAMQREPTEADACAIAQLGAAFEAANLDIRELLVVLAKSDSFRFRSAHLIPDVTEPSAPSGSVTGLPARRRLVLDFVLQEVQAFRQKLPMEDIPLLEQYMSSLRELEQKLAAGQLP